MFTLSKSNIARPCRLNKKSVVNHRYRPAQVCTPDNAILSQAVIVEYLSHKHIVLTDGVSIGYVIDTMTGDQCKLLVELSKDVLLHELKDGLLIIFIIYKSLQCIRLLKCK